MELEGRHLSTLFALGVATGALVEPAIVAGIHYIKGNEPEQATEQVVQQQSIKGLNGEQVTIENGRAVVSR